MNKYTLLLILSLVGCSPNQIQPAKQDIPIPSLESLMPKFEVRRSGQTNYSVWTMTYDKTNWFEVVQVPTEYDAYAVIADTKARLIIKYEVAKQLKEALAR